MFGNYRQLPPDYIVRPIRNSDIFDLIKLFISESFLRLNELYRQDAILKYSPIIIGISLMIFWYTTGSFIVALYRILLLLLLPTSPIVLIALILVCCEWYYYIHSDECLVIYHQNKIRAFVAASDYNNYSYIKYLLVSNVYRERGLGTYLITRIRQNLNYPIYLLSFPEPSLVEFYRSNGFVTIEEYELPRRIRVMFKNISLLIPMVLENNMEI